MYIHLVLICSGADTSPSFNPIYIVHDNSRFYHKYRSRNSAGVNDANTAAKLKSDKEYWESEQPKRKDAADNAQSEYNGAAELAKGYKTALDDAKAALDKSSDKYSKEAAKLVSSWNKLVGKNSAYGRALTDYNKKVDAYNKARAAYEKLFYGKQYNKKKSKNVAHMSTPVLQIDSTGAIKVVDGKVKVNKSILSEDTSASHNADKQSNTAGSASGRRK